MARRSKTVLAISGLLLLAVVVGLWSMQQGDSLAAAAADPNPGRLAWPVETPGASADATPERTPARPVGGKHEGEAGKVFAGRVRLREGGPLPTIGMFVDLAQRSLLDADARQRCDHSITLPPSGRFSFSLDPEFFGASALVNLVGGAGRSGLEELSAASGVRKRHVRQELKEILRRAMENLPESWRRG